MSQQIFIGATRKSSCHFCS